MKGGVGLSLPCHRKKLPSKTALLGLKDDHTLVFENSLTQKTKSARVLMIW